MGFALLPAYLCAGVSTSHAVNARSQCTHGGGAWLGGRRGCLAFVQCCPCSGVPCVGLGFALLRIVRATLLTQAPLRSAHQSGVVFRCSSCACKCWQCQVCVISIVHSPIRNMATFRSCMDSFWTTGVARITVEFHYSLCHTPRLVASRQIDLCVRGGFRAVVIWVQELSTSSVGRPRFRVAALWQTAGAHVSVFCCCSFSFWSSAMCHCLVGAHVADFVHFCGSASPASVLETLRSSWVGVSPTELTSSVAGKQSCSAALGFCFAASLPLRRGEHDARSH